MPHFGVLPRICDLYSTCLAYMDCLPGSALKAVNLPLLLPDPSLRCAPSLMLLGGVSKLMVVEQCLKKSCNFECLRMYPHDTTVLVRSELVK